jgi:hypothetical protein
MSLPVERFERREVFQALDFTRLARAGLAEAAAGRRVQALFVAPFGEQRGIHRGQLDLLAAVADEQRQTVGLHAEPREITLAEVASAGPRLCGLLKRDLVAVAADVTGPLAQRHGIIALGDGAVALDRGSGPACAVFSEGMILRGSWRFRSRGSGLSVALENAC